MIDKLLRFTFLLVFNQEITSTLHLSTENNHVLVGYAFKQFFARDWLACIQACHDEPGCIAYNYERSKGANGLCELNDCGVENLTYSDRLLIYSLGSVYQQVKKGKQCPLKSDQEMQTRNSHCGAEELSYRDHLQRYSLGVGNQQIREGKQCLLKNCQEIRREYSQAKSGVYLIDPLNNAEPIEVYCDFDIEGGGFSFLPDSLTLRSSAKQIVESLFKDKNNVLLKLKKIDGNESHTLIQPHPDYNNIDFGVLVNNFSGYTPPMNDFMKEYIFLGILPESVAKEKTFQGFRSNGKVIQFQNCDGNPNSLFAFMPNRNGQTPHSHASNSGYEEHGVAVEWISTAKPITSLEHKMPKGFFFLTELHFGGCGCYTSSDRWLSNGFNSKCTAIGIR